MKRYLIETIVYYNITKTQRCLSARTDYRVEAKSTMHAIDQAIYQAKHDEHFGPYFKTIKILNNKIIETKE